MTFLRPLEYHANRFSPKQEEAWLAYKAGLTPVLPWGRRSGKSDLFAEILIEDVEDYGRDCLFVAKTQKQARKIIWPKFSRRLRNNSDWKVNESRLEVIHIPSGASTAVKGADLRADDLAGGAYRLIVCDEFALWKKPEIKELILAPMLVDYDGQFIFGSTKRGKNHFFKLHQDAKKNPSKYFFNEATMWDNPFISESGRSKVISEYPGGEQNPLYQQEVLNKYVVFSGQVFALASESYTEKRWDRGDMEHAFHWRGMDHGFSPDPTACVWIAYNAKKGYFQVYSNYKQEKLLIDQHATAIKDQEPYPIVDTHSDIDPQVMAEYGKPEVGLHLTAANKKDKKARLLALVTALRVGRVKITYDCADLLAEMNSLTWENVDKKDGDDHLIDAFDYGFNNLVIPQKSVDDEDEDFSTSRTENPDHQDFGD